MYDLYKEFFDITKEFELAQLSKLFGMWYQTLLLHKWAKRKPTKAILALMIYILKDKVVKINERIDKAEKCMSEDN